MNSQDRGDLSKIKLIGALMKSGKKILDTVGENHRFDFCFYEECVGSPVKILKVQAKTARIVGGSLVFGTCSVVKNKETKKFEKRRYSKDQIDFYGAYAPELDKCYLIPISLNKKHDIKLRLTQERAMPNSVFAKQFEI
jgi:hypothetical protein